MNKNTNKKEIPKKALELVPWYTVGVLSNEEKAYFEQALEEYPELQEHLNEDYEMARLLTTDKSLLDLSMIAPPTERLKDVLNQIDVLENNKDPVELGLFDKVKQALNGLTMGNTWTQARVASALVLVISVVILGAIVSPLLVEEQFTPASAKVAEENSTENTVLLLGFNGKSSDLNAYPLLKDKLSSIEAVANKKGMYRLSLNQKLTKPQMQELVKALEAKKESVWFVGEAF